MADKLRRAFLCLGLGLVAAGTGIAQAQRSQPPAPPAFTEKTASDLLLQLSEAVESHSQKKMLALFDLPQMKGGGPFKEQINLFFTQTESIRVHMNLVETTVEADRPGFTVDAEMDVQPSNGGQAWRRSDRLTLTVTKAGGSWRFVEIQPRSFFSLP